MHNIEKLIHAAHREFGFPEAAIVTDEYVEAAKTVAQQSKKQGTKFPMIEVANVPSGQSERLPANAAELIIEGLLPITLAPNTEHHDDTGVRVPLVMARLTILNMVLAERVGLDATNSAIQIPPFDSVRHRSLRALGTWYDDNYFRRVPQRETTIHEIQAQLGRRYGGPSIFSTDTADTHFNIVPILPLRPAENRLRQELSSHGFMLLKTQHPIGMEQDQVGYSAVAPPARNLPRPIRIASGDTYRLAANEALLVLEDAPDSILGPQEYWVIDEAQDTIETVFY